MKRGGGGALVSVRADSREALWSVKFAIRDSDRVFPVGIWCQNDVVSTLMRRNHVILGHVHVGFIAQLKEY